MWVMNDVVAQLRLPAQGPGTAWFAAGLHISKAGRTTDPRSPPRPQVPDLNVQPPRRGGESGPGRQARRED